MLRSSKGRGHPGVSAVRGGGDPARSDGLSASAQRPLPTRAVPSSRPRSVRRSGLVRGVGGGAFHGVRRRCSLRSGKAPQLTGRRISLPESFLPAPERIEHSEYDTPRVDRYWRVTGGTRRQQKPASRCPTGWVEDQARVLGVRKAGLGRRQQHSASCFRGQRGGDACRQNHRHKYRHHQDLDHPFHRPTSLFLTFLPSTHSRYQTEADDGIVQVIYYFFRQRSGRSYRSNPFNIKTKIRGRGSYAACVLAVLPETRKRHQAMVTCTSAKVRRTAKRALYPKPVMIHPATSGKPRIAPSKSMPAIGSTRSLTCSSETLTA